MNIVICVKAVKSELVFMDKGNEDPYFFNPYDLKALEECIKLKEETGSMLTCISMGPIEVATLLEKSLAMGIDQAILLNDVNFIGSDTLATSYVLSMALKKLGDFDLIVCGEKSIDGETGQVVYGLGERLHIPIISGVKSLSKMQENTLTFSVQNDNETFSASSSLPILISISELSTTYPKLSLLRIKQAKLKPLLVWNAEELGVDTDKCGVKGSRTKVKKVRNSMNKREKEEVTGAIESKVMLIFELLNSGRDL